MKLTMGEIRALVHIINDLEYVSNDVELECELTMNPKTRTYAVRQVGRARFGAFDGDTVTINDNAPFLHIALVVE